VDVGKSVSRVGGKAQIVAYRKVAGDLRLSYTQFQELESFARFGTRLDEGTRKTLEHGKRVREALKQDQFTPLSAGQQIAVLLAVTKGIIDDVPVEKMGLAEESILEKAKRDVPELDDVVAKAGANDPVWEKLVELTADAVKTIKENHANAGISEQKDQDRQGSPLGGQDHEEPGRR
jgi:F-type H+-transporting ATPase subunit alpha